MDHRVLAQVVSVVLHTIVSERGLVNEAHVVQKELDRLVFSQCVEKATAAYIDDVVWALKSVVSSKGQAKARLQIWSDSALIEEWHMEVQVGPMSLGDVQVVIDQITAAASYLPQVSAGSVFKVSLLLDKSLKLPSKCRVANTKSLLRCEKTSFRDLPSLRVWASISMLENSSGALGSAQ